MAKLRKLKYDQVASYLEKRYGENINDLQINVCRFLQDYLRVNRLRVTSTAADYLFDEISGEEAENYQRQEAREILYRLLEKDPEADVERFYEQDHEEIPVPEPTGLIGKKGLSRSIALQGCPKPWC